MKVQKQIEIMHPLYMSELDNAVCISVYGDYAIGSDGKKYYHVGREGADGMLLTVGWCSEIDKAMVLEE